jgi:PAS domain S-box-containing protein
MSPRRSIVRSGLTRQRIQYLIAGLLPIALIPILTGRTWPGLDTIRPFAAYILFLGIAMVGRLFGFRPALLCTLTSAFALWMALLTTEHPAHVTVLRVTIFTVSSILIASVSRQRVKEVGAAEERLRALFDTTLDAILFADREGHYIDANPAAAGLLGYSCEELIGRNVGDFTVPELREVTLSAFQQAIKTGTASGEGVIVLKDGTRREIEYRSMEHPGPDVRFVVMRDITDRKKTERALQHVSGRLLQLQDEERRRIARHLHDTTAQSLAAVSLNLSRISRSPAAAYAIVREIVEESMSLTDQSIAEIRTLSYLLHPPMIDESGLLPSLRWCVRGFEQRTGIRVTLIAPEQLDRLSQELETALFRIVQEALTNIQRHSGSTVATVRVERLPQCLRLEIEDEGWGIRQELREEPSALFLAGVGIPGMQHRLLEFGGHLEIVSLDRGTRLSVTVPISPR